MSRAAAAGHARGDARTAPPADAYTGSVTLQDAPAAPGDLTLGILAGGLATRLHGRDKAWLARGGVPQVVRIARAHRTQVAWCLVSANGDGAAFAAVGLPAVADRHAGLGPIGGLHALAQACTTTWLFTLPVDALALDAALPERLAAAAGQGNGACLADDDGPQPLAALWRVNALREASHAAIEAGTLSVQALQRALGMPALRVKGLHLGNLNTPADLQAAGMDDP